MHRDAIAHGRRIASRSRSTIRSKRTSSSSPGIRTRPCTTCSRISRRCGRARTMITKLTRRFAHTRFAFAAPILLVLIQSANAQLELDPAELLDPQPESRPTYHGDYTGPRHSLLTDITPQKVHTLTPAWPY